VACGTEPRKPTEDQLRKDVSDAFQAIIDHDADALYEFYPESIRRDCPQELFRSLAEIVFESLPPGYSKRSLRIEDVVIQGATATYTSVLTNQSGGETNMQQRAIWEDARWRDNSNTPTDKRCGL
jgi:hypothetical protein